jgi:Asp-tRNA(Asn)/Glu-tRNA(Gln) amidotransferase A subunit family amidase
LIDPGSIARTRRAFLDGRLTPSAHVEATLAQIATSDRDLRAFLTLDEHGARRAARDAEAELRDGRARPLSGIPVSLKDAYRTATPATSFGSRATVRCARARDEGTLVQRLRALGAAIVGKTNLSELCIGDYVLRASPRPPLTPDRCPGASSGGCAVAVAAGLVSASLATDTGGSVRSPAAYCGVVGFKPTSGTLAVDGILPLAPSLDHAGVIARSVADAAFVVEALRGRPMPAWQPPRTLLVVREGVRTAAIADALSRVAACAPPAGATTSAAPADPFTGWREAFAVLMPAEAGHEHRALLPDPQLGDGARTILAAGAAIDDSAWRAARAQRHALCQRIEALLPPGAVLIGPAVDGVAPQALPPRGSEAFWSEMDWLAPLNLAGNPALCVPIPDTLPPVALQVVGRRGEDGAVVAVGAWVESALSR